MTTEEIERIGEYTFDKLWDDLWGDVDKKVSSHIEYEKSKKNFDELKNNCKELGLNFYVKNVSPSWNQAEWGFPKGRRNKNENNLECAMREFEEEAGYSRHEYEILTNMTPLVEEFIGTNGVSYKHVYYIGIDKSDKNPQIDKNNKNQSKEIGAIGFYTFQDTIQLIRPYHIQRKKIINKLYNYLMNKVVLKMNKVD
jgi:8-oxo-dGTP pyrophosphatase MutT (NUDIX family)